MEAGEARRRTHTAAERMRIATESARENARLEAESELHKLEEAIATTVRMLRAGIDKEIAEAANLGKSYTRHEYSERISGSRNTREEVAFIEGIADAVTERLLADLQTDGYDVSAQSKEVVDYRDRDTSPPEYYDTSIFVKW